MANLETGKLKKQKAEVIIKACDEIIEGKHNDWFPLDPFQGGAGTSMNMNMNEVIANLAIKMAGSKEGDYSVVHPLDDVNMHQSTNDVYPTAVKVAVLDGLKNLSRNIEGLQGSFQGKEKEFSDTVKIGRTEMQDAVPMTLGAEFSAFSEAIARDRWRVFKCEERIRQVNIGGTAIGTGLTAPKSYIFLVIEKLRELTGFGLTRGENAVDQTANSDNFVEVAGILKAHAANIIKICNDLRMLNLLGEIKLDIVQAGSSIMPGKVNPVILEAAIQAALRSDSDCNLVSEAASRATLQINEFMPLLSLSILEAIELLSNVDKMLTSHVKAIRVDSQICMNYFENNPTIVTAFLPYIGYEACENILKEFYELKDEKISIKVFLKRKLGDKKVEEILSPSNLMSLGYRDNEKST
jgi:aspartate ammonia-lyase